MKIKYTFLILLLMTAIGCRKDKTNWNTDWVVPLINDSLLIKDYVNDTTLAINSDQTIQIIAERKLIDLDLTSLIKIPDTTIEQTFVIGAPTLDVAPGSSFIDNTKEYKFSFDDIALTSVRIKSGKAIIHVENPVDNKGVFKITLPGVYKNGVELSRTEIVPKGTTSSPGISKMILDLAGYTIDMTGTSGQLYNLLQSKMQISTDPDGPVFTLTNQDVFKSKVEFNGMLVDYAKGYFGNIVFSDTTTVNIDELSKITGGAINIDDINLELIIKNGIVARAKGQVTLFESINLNNNVVGLTHPYFAKQFNVDPAVGTWSSLTPSELPFLFNQSTGNMKEFIENIGREYNIGYAIELNPLGNTSSGNDVLYPKSRLGVDLRANFPLLIGADNLVLQDTFDIDFKNDNKLIRVLSGKLILHTVNTFPYGAEVKLVLLDKDKIPLKQISSSGLISPALTNTAGDGHIPIEEKMEFLIDKEVADLLPETKSIMITAVFNSTNLNNNKVFANAALKLLLMSELKLKSEL